MSSKRVLVVDAVGARRRVHAFGLRCAGFTADEADDWPTAHAHIANHFPHLVLIIVGCLDARVESMVKTLRADGFTSDVPVLVLVDVDSEQAKRHALALGVDDYLCNPIAPDVFVERVRAAIERRLPGKPIRDPSLGLVLDESAAVARLGTRSVPLGPTEVRLLDVLLSHPGQTLPRDLLLFRLWGAKSAAQSRVLDVSVCRLRRAFKKLGCAGAVETVRNHGYRFINSNNRGTR